jgi:hypothetical protein
MKKELEQKLAFTISQFIEIDEREAHKRDCVFWAHFLYELKGTKAIPFIWDKFKRL